MARHVDAAAAAGCRPRSGRSRSSASAAAAAAPAAPATPAAAPPRSRTCRLVGLRTHLCAREQRPEGPAPRAADVIRTRVPSPSNLRSLWPARVAVAGRVAVVLEVPGRAEALQRRALGVPAGELHHLREGGVGRKGSTSVSPEMCWRGRRAPRVVELLPPRAARRATRPLGRRRPRPPGIWRRDGGDGRGDLLGVGLVGGWNGGVANPCVRPSFSSCRQCSRCTRARPSRWRGQPSVRRMRSGLLVE